MPMQKKAPQKRGSTRDIAIKKSPEDSFTVQRIESRSSMNQDMSAFQPVHETMDEQQQLEETMEEVLSSEDLMNEVREEEANENKFPVFAPENVEPKELVKVRFSKFVQLVASHDFDEVVKNNENEDVVLSSNLLTELAGAHDEREQKKIPIIFLVGLAIGVVLTYILLNK